MLKKLIKITFVLFILTIPLVLLVRKDPKVKSASVFNKYITKEEIPTKDKAPEIILIATGDILPARSVNSQAVRKDDYMWAFENIKELLKSGDITLINLETPLIKECPVTDEGMIFCGSQKHIEGLNASGVDVVNVANNHMGNWGIDGVNQTKKLLQDNNMLVSGLNQNNVVYKTVKGVKFAFLGYNDIGTQVGTATALNATVQDEIKQADQNADVVVVSFHWGWEYTSEPNERQIELAHLAVDSGADLIIGNHPHWEQSDETYKDVYIKYAHGNTIFDQMWSEETKKGVIGKYKFIGNQFDSVEFVKTYIKDYGQPEIVK